MMNHRFVACALGLVLVGSACGANKNYGEPLADPNAELHANAAVTNAAALSADTTNDSSLAYLNGLSGSMNLLAGLKAQRDQAMARLVDRPLSVPEECVVVSDTGIVYTDCDWNGVTVNGSIARSGTHVSIDIEFVSDFGTDTTQTTVATAEIDISETAIDGFVDYDLEIVSEGFTNSATFDGDFDVVLQDGCPVDGQLEIHAVAKASGFTQDVWVKAEYGPTCGDVAVY